MTDAELKADNRRLFLEALRANREVACKVLADAKVDEWYNDGPEEVARCLKCWMDQGLNLGDEGVLMDRFDSACYVACADPGKLREWLAEAKAELAKRST